MTELMLGPEELTPIPYIERCDYKDFLAELVRCHGETYLQRPDGTLLDGVVFIPQPRPKRRKPKRQVPTLPPGYTGNPMDDFQPQMKGLQVMVEYERPDGRITNHEDYSVKGQVIAALVDKPLTLREIAAVTKLTTEQVKRVLARYQGELLEMATDKPKDNQWRLMAADKQTTGPRVGQMSVRERIEQHIIAHGPATSRQLADALNVKPNIIQITAHKAETISVVGKIGEKLNLWGVTQGQQATPT